jgi:hypothetical protein
METAEILLSALDGAQLIVVRDEPLIIPVRRSERHQMLKLIEMLPDEHRILLEEIVIRGTNCTQAGKLLGITQASIHHRLVYLHRWLTHVPGRRRALEDYLGVSGCPEELHAPYMGRTQVVDLRKAWDHIVWQHQPLLTAAALSGARSQGRLHDAWQRRFVSMLDGRRYPKRVKDVLKDILDRPVYWRIPGVIAINDARRHPLACHRDRPSSVAAHPQPRQRIDGVSRRASTPPHR